MDKKRAPLKRKLIGYIIFLLIIANIGLGIPSYLLAREELEKKGQVILSNAVHMAINEIETMALNVEAGAITLEDAQERVKSTLIGPETTDGKRLLNTPIDLGDNGYFLAYNDQGYEVMHPTIEGGLCLRCCYPRFKTEADCSRTASYWTHWRLL
jgi:methyl-accepting chemotaxis protein